jgi:hypothetical protein
MQVEGSAAVAAIGSPAPLLSLRPASGRTSPPHPQPAGLFAEFGRRNGTTQRQRNSRNGAQKEVDPAASSSVTGTSNGNGAKPPGAAGKKRSSARQTLKRRSPWPYRLFMLSFAVAMAVLMARIYFTATGATQPPDFWLLLKVPGIPSVWMVVAFAISTALALASHAALSYDAEARRLAWISFLFSVYFCVSGCPPA